jgi:hypothetical protein
MTGVEKYEGPGDSSPDFGEHEYKGSGHEGAQLAGLGGGVKDQEEDLESNGHVSDEGAKSAGGPDKPEPNDEKPGLQESKPGNEHNVGTSSESITQNTPYNTAKTLKALCSETNWKEGLWLQCHSYCGINETSICGGLNSARNRLQTCLRLAIHAGSSLILPTVATQRHFDNPSAFGNASVCPDVYWDVAFLEKAMKRECPQLSLRRCGDVQGIHEVIQGPRRGYMDAKLDKGAFEGLIDSTLVEKKTSQVSAKHQVAIGYGDTYIAYNYTAADEMSIRKDLFNTLKFNSSLLAMGSSILHSPQLQGWLHRCTSPGRN